MEEEGSDVERTDDEEAPPKRSRRASKDAAARAGSAATSAGSAAPSPGSAATSAGPAAGSAIGSAAGYAAGAAAGSGERVLLGRRLSPWLLSANRSAAERAVGEIAAEADRSQPTWPTTPHEAKQFSWRLAEFARLARFRAGLLGGKAKPPKYSYNVRHVVRVPLYMLERDHPTLFGSLRYVGLEHALPDEKRHLDEFKETAIDRLRQLFGLSFPLLSGFACLLHRVEEHHREAALKCRQVDFIRKVVDTTQARLADSDDDYFAVGPAESVYLVLDMPPPPLRACSRAPHR